MTFNFIQKGSDLFIEDPIYGEIKIYYPFSAIVLTKEMKRLSKICQTGFTRYDYTGMAEGNRLNHSIGAWHVMELMLNKLSEVLKPYGIEISKDDRDIALCSMLMHDIGHGPFSHSFEKITGYSHEKRTTDIILGDTELYELLVSLFGEYKVRKIANFIVDIDDEKKLAKDSFTKLLKSLVSHQLDADRLDYLARDAHYAGIKSVVDLEKIIDSLNVVVNSDQEYELLIDKKGVSSIELLLIQRFQMYRDVYYCHADGISEFLFKELMNRFLQNKKLHDLPLPKSFLTLVSDPNIADLANFLEMNDGVFNEAFSVLAKNEIDPLLAYISDFSHLQDYVDIETDAGIEKLKEILKEIFGEIDLSNTLSIISYKKIIKLYKKTEGLKIQYGNRILDLADCTNLIKSQKDLEVAYRVFNPEVLRLELGMSKEEFTKYENDLKKALEDLNKKPEEFELKYAVDFSTPDFLDKIIELFNRNGFSIVSTSKKENHDEYYDTDNMDLYYKGGSLRIRTAFESDKVKYKGTFKMPLDEGEVYTSRSEHEEKLVAPTFEELTKTMNALVVVEELANINDRPVLNSTTERTEIVLEKNGVQVCLSLDKSRYTNHRLNDISIDDMMIEIEAVGKIKDRVILNGIHAFLTENIEGLELIKDSKYVRGINGTMALAEEILNGESAPTITGNGQRKRVHN